MAPNVQKELTECIHSHTALSMQERIAIIAQVHAHMPQSLFVQPNPQPVYVALSNIDAAVMQRQISGVSVTLTAPGSTCFRRAAWRLPLQILVDEAFVRRLAAIIPNSILVIRQRNPQTDSMITGIGAAHAVALAVYYVSGVRHSISQSGRDTRPEMHQHYLPPNMLTDYATKNIGESLRLSFITQLPTIVDS